jgi:hypothetical protein
MNSKKFKPTLVKIPIDLPYMIHGKKVKIVINKLLLNEDDDNDIDNIENLLNKFLKNYYYICFEKNKRCYKISNSSKIFIR